MAHLIKLESGQYLNLDHFIRTRDLGGDEYEAIIVGGWNIALSDKDLEKIEEIAEGNEPMLRSKISEAWNL